MLSLVCYNSIFYSGSNNKIGIFIGSNNNKLGIFIDNNNNKIGIFQGDSLTFCFVE